MNLDRISACTYAVRKETLGHAFGLVSRSGFTKVDLWGGAPNYANDPTLCDIPAIAAKARSYGLLVANLGTYPGRRFFEVGHDAELREMKWAVDNAVTLGSRSIRVNPGDGEDPAMIDSLTPFFVESARYAERQRVYLGMENHQGSLAGNPELIMRLVRAVGSPWFGILFEPANLMNGKVDYSEAYEAFRGSIVHVHVKDSRWKDGKYERTMLGEGEIDWAWLTRTLETDGYRGDYALEFEIEERVNIAEGLPKWLERFRGL